jgi:hypothetical protein
LLGFLLSACGESETRSISLPTITTEPTQETFNLEIKVIPQEGGQILPGDGSYAENTEVILNAIPNKGFVLVEWSGDGSGLENTIQITMDNNKLVIANFSQLATSTPQPPPTITPIPCRNPVDVIPEDAGQLIEVCGQVSNWGTVSCPDCPLGSYSFLKLDGEFLIISYEWVFSNDWLDACISVFDTVEMLGAEPVFTFGSGEGYAGSECIEEEDGSYSCTSGDYFQFYDLCEFED